MLIDSGDTNITPHGRSTGVSVALASPSAFDRMLYGILRVRRPQSELVVSTVRDGWAGWGAGTPPPPLELQVALRPSRLDARLVSIRAHASHA